MSNYILLYFIGEVLVPECKDIASSDGLMAFTGPANAATGEESRFGPGGFGKTDQDGRLVGFNGVAGYRPFDCISTDVLAGDDKVNPFSHPVDTAALLAFTVKAPNGSVVTIQTTADNSNRLNNPSTTLTPYGADRATLATNTNKTRQFQQVAFQQDGAIAGFGGVTLADTSGAGGIQDFNIFPALAAPDTMFPGKFTFCCPEPTSATGDNTPLVQFTVGGDTIFQGENLVANGNDPAIVSNFINDTIANERPFIFTALFSDFALAGGGNYPAGRYAVAVDVECVIT